MRLTQLASVRKLGVKEICKETQAIRKLLHAYKWRERELYITAELWSHYYVIVWLYIVLDGNHTHRNLNINSCCCEREWDHTWIVRSYPVATSWNAAVFSGRNWNWKRSLKGKAEHNLLFSLIFNPKTTNQHIFKRVPE